ncbi:type I-E CRISPR-associated protein Cse2/CasB [Nocardia sp. CC227C]|uniref:type I-E CRISPR-associated protein Cse2/CasB n=1 Tax=Nocardia sp. CC227C TaxID=3044562 RepID=UPI00278BF611|nr:type I-E CRISPR-associated protein Cse2/CasB [Nocardia sp. CC227C]
MNDTTATAPTYADRDQALKEFVTAQVSAVQNRYLRDSPDAVAALARLRRGVGHPAGSQPDLYALTLDNLPEILTDPAYFTGRERAGLPTPWEQAAHDAITLHAWHQQSKAQRMHRPGIGFGAAMRQLGEHTNPEGVRRRFHALGTAAHHHGRLIMLRSLVGQLRAETIPLDYGRLASDLRRLHRADSARRVLLQWGRDYHRTPTTTSGSGQDGTSPAEGDIK